MLKLNFAKKNAKLDNLVQHVGGKVYSFSVLSGHNCPGADICQAFAMQRPDGSRHVLDGKRNEIRCFSASQEAFYKNVYDSRNHNGELIKLAAKSIPQACQAILDNIPKDAKAIRIHVGGDFKTQAYFDSWLAAAKARPSILFYTYTKSLPFWLKRRDEIPANLKLTASYGGKFDSLIAPNNLPFALMVDDDAQAESLGLPIDHDDSHAAIPSGNFALNIHGIQRPGSRGAKAEKVAYTRNGLKNRKGNSNRHVSN